MKKEERLTKNIYGEHTQKEWKRVIKDPFHRLEFDTTMRFLKKYLPKKGLILDAGGGPGRYSIELAKKGYDVTLLDITPENLELAKKKIKKEKVQKKIKEIAEGSIINLSKFKTGTFDAVLCLGGPLSHVHPEKNRKKAISELVRVVKKGSPIFVSVMGKFGVIIDSPRRFPKEINMTKHFFQYAYHGDDYMWYGGKAFCHFFTLKELEKLMSSKTEIIEKVGLEGLGSANRMEINRLAKSKKYPKAWKNWLKAHEKLCTDPTVVDLSQHFMVIGRKR